QQPLSVAQAPVGLSVATLHATRARDVYGVIASFAAGPFDLTTQYTATIEWGDNTVDAGVPVLGPDDPMPYAFDPDRDGSIAGYYAYGLPDGPFADGSDSFRVFAGHTYATTGAHQIKVTVQGGPATATADGWANVSENYFDPNPPRNPSLSVRVTVPSAAEGLTFTAPVATFAYDERQAGSYR